MWRRRKKVKKGSALGERVLKEHEISATHRDLKGKRSKEGELRLILSELTGLFRGGKKILSNDRFRQRKRSWRCPERDSIYLGNTKERKLFCCGIYARRKTRNLANQTRMKIESTLMEKIKRGRHISNNR